MGGGQSLNFGLGNLDTFAWVGGFSSAPNTKRPADLIKDHAEAAKKLKLLYVACGDKDGLFRISEGVHKMLDEKKVPHVYHVIPGGGHDFKVWKSDLYHFAQLIFREPEQAAPEKKDEPKPAEKKEPDKPADEGKPASTNVGNARYPRVHADGRATFRLKAPDAKKVQVFTNYGLGPRGPWDMTKGDDGVWTLTSPPIVPGFHYYALPRGRRAGERPRQRHLLRHRQADERDRDPREGRGLLPRQGRAARRGPLAVVQVEGDGPARGTSWCTPRRATTPTRRSSTRCCTCSTAAARTRPGGASRGT